MTVFLSTYVNSIDKKGRVSVPALFRAEMAAQSRQTIVVYADKNAGFLYGWGYDDFIAFAKNIQKLPPMSKERQRLSRTILAAARPVSFDSEGRIMLPQDLLDVAGVNEKILFAGQGEYFTLWNPEKYEALQTDDFAHFESDVGLLSGGWEVE